jgi:four helix bundle protein
MSFSKEINMQIGSPKDLVVFKKAYSLAMEVFHASKDFPRDERYSMTDQIRRSSRSICSNLREAWAKRRYPAHFVCKLTDADSETGETETWLDFARDCGYLPASDHDRLAANCREIGAMIGSMIKNPSPFILRSPNANR